MVLDNLISLIWIFLTNHSAISSNLGDFELNELYKSFQGAITSIKVNLDYSEEYLFISDNFETYFGYTADELIKHWDSFLR